MKQVLISIQPKWVEKICHEIGKENGKPIYEKVAEVRKSRPKLETPFKCNIYCTKDNKTAFNNHNGNMFLSPKGWQDYSECNGKVIGEFVCDDIEYITPSYGYLDACCIGGAGYILDKCCLTSKDLIEYGKGKELYGWHISDLKIYDKPKELSEFYTFESNIKCEHQKNYYIYPFCEKTNKDKLCRDIKDCPRKRKQLTRPPHSWCYVESLGE